MPKERRFLDRDFIETEDGLLFCVVGNVHPEDRVISYLKYIPARSMVNTKWRRGDTPFQRILPFYSAVGVSQVRPILEERHPDYIVWDDVLGIEMIEVPVTDVRKHLLPEMRVREILREPRDPLEETVEKIVTILSRESGVPTSAFGVTGSILLKIHNLRYSDVDLTIYGKENSLKVRDAILRLIEEDSSFYRPSGRTLEEWAREIAEVYPLSLKEAMVLRGRDKWDRLFFRERQFSIHPVLTEVKERYGDKIYRGKGLVEVMARVSNSEYSLFMPAVYEVDEVEALRGQEVPDVREVVSYESLYTDIAREGEWIRVFGKLEEVRDIRRGEIYHRIVVGTFEAKGRDYIKPERWLSVTS